MEWKVSYCCCLIVVAPVLLVFVFDVVVVVLVMCSWLQCMSAGLDERESRNGFC